MKPYIKVIRFSNGMLCMLTPDEPLEDKGWTVKDDYTCYSGTEIGYITSCAMGLHGTVYVDGTNGNHVRVNNRSFKIDNLELSKGDFLTIDLGGRCSRYSGR
jgi:hypothetical protein